MARSKANTKSSNTTKASKVTRKKFAVPPVKVACLECRASRTRCDGKTECSNCVNKGKTCVYTSSKRGGSRIRKSQASSNNNQGSSSPSNNNELNTCSLSILPETFQASFAEPLSMVTPGGGLKQLDFAFDDTDLMFDAIFSSQPGGFDSGYDTSEHSGPVSDVGQISCPIRVYSSDEDILGAYYTYIHPYFPVLPPPQVWQITDNVENGVRRAPDAIFASRKTPDFEPSSPLSLAISATLALIPHPDDIHSSGSESVHLRREQAQAFAQSAFESIEIESELIESEMQPSDALSSDPAPLTRKQFHPQNPLENESVIALLLLSTYEYAQRGNIAKMRNRAGQALNAAMNLALHEKENDQGWYAEANRRVWWMTYIIVCQGSILSNSSPPFLLYDPRFTTKSPTFVADTESWEVFLQSQQVIVSATQFVIDLDKTLKSNSDLSRIREQMLELEGMIEPLATRADSWILNSSPTPSLDESELKVAQSLRGMARIKLNSARIKIHRYCAFSDIPIFTKKHCDLRPADLSTDAKDTPMAPQCGCSSTFHQLPSALDPSLSPNSTQSQSPTLAAGCSILPFSSNFSAKVCLKSALSIARSFQGLPFPKPNQRNDPMSLFPFMDEVNSNSTPRLIPVFACCAMQSSYAMIMLSYKTKAMGFVGMIDGKSSPSMKLLEQLQDGLQLVVDALKNYSIAYEALGGMRDQIQLAAESVNILQFNEM